MKKTAKNNKYSRTFLPEILDPAGGSGLSPLTDKSKIPANNVHTIQDVLDGRRYKVPGGGGDWSDLWGEDTFKSYKAPGDDYKREERDMNIINRMSNPPEDRADSWQVRVQGGTRTFSSLAAAQEFKRRMSQKGVPVSWMTRVKTAQSGSENMSNADMVSVFDATFAVESIDMHKGVKETGTCFCVANNTFVTCAHVIQSYDKNVDVTLDMDSIVANTSINLVQGGRRYRAKLIAIDGALDIAVIKADVNAHVLEFQPEFNLGDEVFTVGTPFGYEGNFSFGRISSSGRNIFDYSGAPDFLFVDMAVHSGNSGGPLIHQKSGNVVGMLVVVVGVDSNYGLSAGIKSSLIEEYVANISS